MLYNFGILSCLIHTFTPTPIQKIDHIMTQYDSPHNMLFNDILYAYMRTLFHNKNMNLCVENYKRRVSNKRRS